MSEARDAGGAARVASREELTEDLEIQDSRASDLGPRASDFGPRAADLGSRASHLGPRASDLRPRASRPAPRASSTGLEPRTASALAYLAGPFSGALILLAETSNDDVRFHAWQSLVGLGGLTVAVIATYALGIVAIFFSATAVSVMFGAATAIWIVLLIVWAICVWKAAMGERWHLPLAGRFADDLARRRTIAEG